MLRIQIFLFIVHNLVGFSQQDFQIRIINCYFDLNFPASSSDILDIDSEDGGIAIYKKKLKPYFRLNSSHFKMDTHSTKSLISKKFMFDHRVLILNSNTNFMVILTVQAK